MGIFSKRFMCKYDLLLFHIIFFRDYFDNEVQLISYFIAHKIYSRFLDNIETYFSTYIDL